MHSWFQHWFKNSAQSSFAQLFLHSPVSALSKILQFGSVGVTPNWFGNWLWQEVVEVILWWLLQFKFVCTHCLRTVRILEQENTCRFERTWSSGIIGSFGAVLKKALEQIVAVSVGIKKFDIAFSLLSSFNNLPLWLGVLFFASILKLYFSFPGECNRRNFQKSVQFL